MLSLLQQIDGPDGCTIGKVQGWRRRVVATHSARGRENLVRSQQQSLLRRPPNLRLLVKTMYRLADAASKAYVPLSRPCKPTRMPTPSTSLLSWDRSPLPKIGMAPTTILMLAIRSAVPPPSAALAASLKHKMAVRRSISKASPTCQTRAFSNKNISTVHPLYGRSFHDHRRTGKEEEEYGL